MTEKTNAINCNHELAITHVTVRPTKKERRTKVFLFCDSDLDSKTLIKKFKNCLPCILKEVGIPENTKASWSQKAGCSCGCSPGFILKGHKGLNIFADCQD